MTHIFDVATRVRCSDIGVRFGEAAIAGCNSVALSAGSSSNPGQPPMDIVSLRAEDPRVCNEPPCHQRSRSLSDSRLTALAGALARPMVGVVSLLTVATTLLCASGVRADAKFGSANVCVAESYFASSIAYTAFGEVVNNSVSAHRWVVCPLEHSIVGSNDFDLDVNVFNGKSGADIDCSSFNRNASTPTLMATSSDSSTGLGYDTLNLDLDSSVSDGYYYFRCELPDWEGAPSIGGSYVTTWLFDEPGSADQWGSRFPGAACKQEGGVADPVHYTDSASVKNVDTKDDVWVNCPLIHDNTGVNTYFAAIFVTDNHASEPVECTGYVVDYGFPTIIGTATDTSSGTGFQSLEIPFPNAAFDNSAYWFLRCDIPDTDAGESSVDSYYWNEAD